jgi:hypothetical protein
MKAGVAERIEPSSFDETVKAKSMRDPPDFK